MRSTACLSIVKTIKLSLWYKESVHNSVIARVICSQTPKALAGDLNFICNSKHPQKQGVRKARVDCSCNICCGSNFSLVKTKGVIGSLRITKTATRMSKSNTGQFNN